MKAPPLLARAGMLEMPSPQKASLKQVTYKMFWSGGVTGKTVLICNE
jgi:hypothetical protein